MAEQRGAAVDHVAPGSPTQDGPAQTARDVAQVPQDLARGVPRDLARVVPEDLARVVPEDLAQDVAHDRTGRGKRTHLGADAWGALLRVHAALVPMLDRELQAARRLPLAWYDVLLELNAAPGRRLRMSDLGEKVTLSRTRVSRLVDELGTAGLVAREANPDDRRSAYAVLTAQGRTALRAAAPVYLGGIRDHFADVLSEQELHTITTALDRVIERARRSGGPGGDGRVRSGTGAEGPGAEGLGGA